MKLSIITLAGLAALVAAQDPTATASKTPSPEDECASKCNADDTCCIAACYKVPCPNAAMANDTTACAAACPQGSGTPADTAAYAQCQQNCYSSLFFTGTATGTATNPPATGTATEAEATETTGTEATATATGTSSGTQSIFSGTLASHGESAQKTGSSSNNKEDTDSSSTSTSSSTAANASKTGAASQIGTQLGVAGVFGAIIAAFLL